MPLWNFNRCGMFQGKKYPMQIYFSNCITLNHHHLFCLTLEHSNNLRFGNDMKYPQRLTLFQLRHTHPVAFEFRDNLSDISLHFRAPLL